MVPGRKSPRACICWYRLALRCSNCSRVSATRPPFSECYISIQIMKAKKEIVKSNPQICRPPKGDEYQTYYLTVVAASILPALMCHAQARLIQFAWRSEGTG